jgi:hypothetical protein
LPVENGELGPNVTVLGLDNGGAFEPLDGEGTASPIEVFHPVCQDRLRCAWNDWDPTFAGYANNHAEAGAPVYNTDPNWFYYWEQTPAWFGQPLYSGAKTSHTRWITSEGWVALLGPEVPEPYTPPLGAPDDDLTYDGIDSFGWTVRHEERHRSHLTLYWPTNALEANGNLRGDLDNDGLPDVQEESLGCNLDPEPCNGGPYIPGVGDSDPLDELPDDGERFTIWTQWQWTPWDIASADAVDWADPGHQH